ncbi:S8 family peptidase [Prevotella sp. HUN102]|uniref:S8 family peptidase n=1 Tax=Prevotella sp. HUN102 TaxID=1392486 RepID=UPI0004905024|nr:S8 family peptidase [Prevotella sp. HUN102]
MKKQISLFAFSILLSTSLVAQTIRNHSPKLTSRTISAQLTEKKQYVNAFLIFKENANIQSLVSRYDIHLNVKVGNRYTALIPLQMVDSIADEPSISQIDIGDTTRPMLDSVRILTHIDAVHDGGSGLTSSYKGKNVIVGVIDTGFDFSHPNFKDASGNSRILCAWDQSNQVVSENAYGYGRIYDSTSAVLAAAHDQSFDTHGTHVAGIAAGSASGNYKGMAPEADIVLVATNKTEQGIVDGVDFLLKYAEAQKKPIVINISFGVVLGYKDGSGTLASMIDGLLANKKGVLLAIATGNEGHRAATLRTNSTLKSFWNVPKYGRDNMFVMGEKDGNYTLKLTLRNTKNNDELFAQTFSTATEWTQSYTKFGTSDAANSQLTVSSMLNAQTGRPALSLNLIYRCAENEVWEIDMTAQDGYMMANCDYGTFSSNGKFGFSEGSNVSSVASTATGNEPIAVGAYVSKRYYTDIMGKKQDMKWQKDALYPMSGQGPTFDGRIKPDVVAPGAAVVSSFNSYAASYSIPNNLKTHSIISDGRNYCWGVAYGTSMATPVVAGTMALWLEAKNDLTAAEVRDLLSTSVTDGFTSTVPNNAYGRGKLNALEGLKKLVETASVSSIPSDASELHYMYDSAARSIIALGANSIQLYTASGILIKRTEGNRMQLGNVPSGIYVVHIKGNTVKSVKIKI